MNVAQNLLIGLLTITVIAHVIKKKKSIPYLKNKHIYFFFQ